MHRETAANVSASMRKKNNILAVITLLKIKIKVTGPMGNSENCFPLTRNENKTRCFPYSQLVA